VHRSYVVRLSQADPARVKSVFVELAAEAAAKIAESGFAPEEVVTHYEIDMRYLGQAHEVAVEVPRELIGAMNEEALAAIGGLFHDRHSQLFGHDSRDSEVELMTLSVSAIGPRHAGAAQEVSEGGPDPHAAFKGRRMVYFEEDGGFVECYTYERALLAAGNEISGPAVIEQMDTTTVIPPGETARVDANGTLIVELSR
jgi:N-methylhydantoinase A